RVRCTGCGDELLVAFSCKRRGVCPSCCARRASDVAAHLVDHVLPRGPYRQWTLSLPIRLRWALARNAALCTAVLNLFVRTLFNALRARARSLALPARACGAVSFIQRFGSALQLNVHFHVLVPEGLFDDDGTFHPLPPPEDVEVESLLATFLRRLVPLLERHGLQELEALPEHALDALQLSSAASAS
ncbi:MAG: transposase zinc-binding domain-containing protein, partial [Myxococcaceae bacterium]